MTQENKIPEEWKQSKTYNIDGNTFKLELMDIYNVIASGTKKPTLSECIMFLHLCEAQKLNPFLKEAYLVKYSENKPASIVIGKDAFEKRANQCSQYKGKKSGVILQRGAELIYQEGAIKLPEDTLIGGWCEVYRGDREDPIKSFVALDEYVGKKSDGTINQQWLGKPMTMIRKVAIVQALREAFPTELNAMYIGEEIDSTNNPKFCEIKSTQKSSLEKELEVEPESIIVEDDQKTTSEGEQQSMILEQALDTPIDRDIELDSIVSIDLGEKGVL
jgi:phage recombination protein Bet